MSGEGLIADRPEGFADFGDCTADVLAEREACLAAFRPLRDRLHALASRADHDGDEPASVDAEAFALELRRTDELFESVRLGLHRVGED